MVYRGLAGGVPVHLRYRRAAMSFMRWQLRRGVLVPPAGRRPGSHWWRAINERLLRDGCEAAAIRGASVGGVSSQAVCHWLSFAARPSAASWYRAHNASVVGGYLEHRELAAGENASERFFINVVLCRVLYAHALVAAPAMALGRLRSLGPVLGDPRLGMAGIFLQLSRALPDEYPLSAGVVEHFLAHEGHFGRLLDFGMVVPRIRQLYEWSAYELDAPGLLDCARGDIPTYAWSCEDGDVWRAQGSSLVRLARRIVPA